MNEKQILGKRILVITAHPDDETFTAAGTLYRNHQQGGVNAVICATLGEKGSAHLQERLSESDLAERRRAELFKVSGFLGIAEGNVYIAGVPDTAVKHHHSALMAFALQHAREFKPEVLLSFDQCGLTAHEDHIAIGAVASEVARELAIPLATFTLPPEQFHNPESAFKHRRHKGKYGHGGSFYKPNVVVAIDREIKIAALRHHPSQFDTQNPLSGVSPELAECVLRNEYFVYHPAVRLWFRRKTYGWGWTPVTWQGWLAIALYVALLVLFGLTIDERSAPREIIFTFILPIMLLTITLIRICYWKGEKPRWQWGKTID